MCEATGGYEAVLLQVLLDLQIAVHWADAAKVKAFIRFFGIRAKNDPLDAKALALYAQERYQRLPVYRPATSELQIFAQLARRRQVLVEMRVQERNRSQAPNSCENVFNSIQAVLACIDQQIESIEAQMATLLKNSVELKQRFDTLASVTGIGPIQQKCYSPRCLSLGH